MYAGCNIGRAGVSVGSKHEVEEVLGVSILYLLIWFRV